MKHVYGTLKALFFDIKDSKIHEFVTRSDLNGVLSLILYDVESPLSWSDNRCRELFRAFYVVRIV